jgi:hypothetical protein
MTMGKMTALGLGFVGAFALGVWTSPHIMQRLDRDTSAAHETVTVPSSRADAEPASPAPAAPVTRRAPVERTARVDVSAPALHERLKPVLNKGAKMDVAAEGFRSAEQFATVAHAARNTEVPFLLLKHRVLEEGKSVAEAIRESKPAANAAHEADVAREQARSDIAQIAG